MGLILLRTVLEDGVRFYMPCCTMFAYLLPLLGLSSSPPIYLFDQHFVVGSYLNGSWNKASKEVAQLPFPTTATTLRVGKLGANTTIRGVDFDDQFETYYITGDDAPKGTFVIGRQPTFPRPITAVGPANVTYLAAVKAKLMKMGLSKAKPKIIAAYKVDLDGNGTQEVLINASNSTEEDVVTGIDGTPKHKGGDYSMLLLRFVDRHGKVHTQDIAANSKERGGLILILTLLDAIGDIDGDGKYEIVTSWRHYEGLGAEMWKFDGKEAKVVISAGVDV